LSRIIGIAGPYCAGKSLAAGLLVSRGCREIDVDALGHAAREARADEIRREFGTTDRAELGRMVFADPERLSRLEALIHPLMKDEVRLRIEEARREGVCALVNAALLFPMSLAEFCDLVVWIDAPWIIRYLRGRKRDGITIPQFLKRVRSQRKLYPQNIEQDVDIITITNVGNRNAFERKVLNLI
jgi:dephospho-CoA kinase